MSKWKIGSLVCALILSANMAWSQGSAKIASEQLVFNFGTIAESDGMASHVFKVKNEGDAPLVITRITASCGCTRPEWSGDQGKRHAETGRARIHLSLLDWQAEVAH